jgi:hypothetical protein
LRGHHGATNPNPKVRHEGAGAQRMKVLLEELSVHFHSDPGGEWEQSRLSKPWVKENERFFERICGPQRE